MNIIATFPQNVKVEYRQTQKMKIVYIYHDFNRKGTQAFPDTIEMQDEGRGSLKGTPIPIHNNFWKYIRKINPDDRSYDYTRSVFKMWINRPYEEGETPRAERIHCGGNFASWDIETDTHIRLISFENGLDTDTLNPQVDNWFNKPYMFWKACAVDIYGRVTKVANGLDVYFPLINDNKGLWMEKRKVMMLPEDYYTFKDGDVYKDGQLYMKTGVVK